MNRFAVADLPYGVSVEAEEDGAGVADDYGRVCRDEKLRMARFLQIMDDLEERELALGRERCLRFVQYVYSLLEAIGEEGKEGFPMGLLQQQPAGHKKASLLSSFFSSQFYSFGSIKSAKKAMNDTKKSHTGLLFSFSCLLISMVGH
jgi:hypothetical protein